LSTAALFVRHLAELRTVGVGFESQSVLQVKLDLSRSGRKPEESRLSTSNWFSGWPLFLAFIPRLFLR
jgi:hypothetical protein